MYINPTERELVVEAGWEERVRQWEGKGNISSVNKQYHISHYITIIIALPICVKVWIGTATKFRLPVFVPLWNIFSGSVIKMEEKVINAHGRNRYVRRVLCIVMIMK